MNKRLLFAMLFVCCAAVLGAPSCGGDNGNGDGGSDVTVGDGGIPPGDGGCWTNCGDGGNCTNLGVSCKAPGDCCSGNCANGACQPPSCTSDNAACTNSGQCCSGTCGSNGMCTPLSSTCKTLGNTCTGGSECCSQYCSGGICAAPSYCGQNGDICKANTDCCGGLCQIQQGKTFGLCGQPASTGAQCSLIDGMLCSSSQNGGDAGFMDSGVPKCGGACCSRDCAPWGATKVLICQPASGCKPVGDICGKDTDCCGGLPLNNQPPSPPGVCNKTNTTDPVGVCANPSGCKPNGDICRLQANQCNATDNCCSGNVQQKDTCKQDNLGVPRCSFAGDAGCIPIDAGTQCATSADCCNLNPCVPDGNGGHTCYPSTCVPVTGVCTTDADCCPGGHCYIQGGQASGTCQPNVTDAGTTCDGGLYGQTCVTATDCCNNVPCNNGRCEIIVN
jgi:hypothetical protein